MSVFALLILFPNRFNNLAQQAMEFAQPITRGFKQEDLEKLRTFTWNASSSKIVIPSDLERGQEDAEESNSLNQKRDLDNNFTDSQYMCIICQCDFEKGEKLRELQCKHVFHKDCVDSWLVGKGEESIGGHKTCPLCIVEAINSDA
ncbi:E3 ubiquitin-protein ligase rnf38 [Clydaea vesicula]|uniref:E3 ubiquitin-protein ligase rnf38 n=1 Tax=Clydaea vesicula TaxID=447962 RepID=A0AAD5TYH6_9FUNG|nr:E3 ubiquitin-protein ligase rnf38 [Clydaea vesicula]